MAIHIKAYANCDRAYVAWRSTKRIPGCLGFALLRRRNGKEEVVDTWVGFEGQRYRHGSHRPSTEWPVQKFLWADYFVDEGDVAQYRVIPMVGSPDELKKATAQGSDWSNPVTVSADTGEGFTVYFNRGIVASQWLARRLEKRGEENEQASLTAAISTPGDSIRDDLSDPLRTALLDLLSKAKRYHHVVYAALFELNDPELIPALAALGGNANVVLANGAAKKKGDDPNHDARTTLTGAGVTVFDRMIAPGHLGHNKFAVVCSAAGTPLRVWTGSTNWSRTGLCTQANNAILIESRTVAGWFKDHWDGLRDARSLFPGDLLPRDDQKAGLVRGRPISTWFTPVVKFADLEQGRHLIDQAGEGILFLMFNPGPRDTLFNTIIDRTDPTKPSFDQTLYIHGVMNQDPGTKKNPIPPVVFTHRGEQMPAGFDVVLPANINEAFAAWSKELLKLDSAFAMVHSKTVVLDPFGAHPVVMTGSHNLGPKASSGNDDNLVIIENAPQLAAAYAVTIMGVYSDYRWRFRLQQRRQARQAAATAPADSVDEWQSTSYWAGHHRWQGLQTEDSWQDGYLTEESKVREIDFWMAGP